MSDTPETDLNKYPADTFCGSGSKTLVVHVDFARRLERKLNEALAKAESIHQDRLKVLVERDQWRECAEKLAARLRKSADWTPCATYKDNQQALAEF